MHYPLLDVREALVDADRDLADVVDYVQTLQAESDGHSPPEAATFLANVAALRELLAEVLPPALQQAIADEQTLYDEDAERWAPTGY